MCNTSRMRTVLTPDLNDLFGDNHWIRKHGAHLSACFRSKSCADSWGFFSCASWAMSRGFESGICFALPRRVNSETGRSGVGADLKLSHRAGAAVSKL